MSKTRLILFLGLIVATILANSQTAPPTLPPRQLPKSLYPRPEKLYIHRRFSLHNQEYLSTIDLPQTNAVFRWIPSSALPLTLAQAEEISRGELRKIVVDEPKWQVSDFQISRAEGGPNWYIAVTLEPGVQVVAEPLPHDSFTVLMDLSGRTGRIGQVTR